MKNISVVIPTYNSWATLKDCIESVYNQTLSAREIIVVNNNSTDNTASNIEKFFPKVKLINLAKNTGVTGGRNAGIKAASGEYIFLFDHDMIADKKMLQCLLSVAESNLQIGIVTPKIYYWSDKKRIWSAGTNINLWTGQVLFRGGRDEGEYETTEEVAVAPAAMLVKTAVIKIIKGFDDQYFAVYEDTDFCFRAKAKGFKTYYSPTAIAYHQLSTDPKDEANRLMSRAFWVGRNRIIFMKKFGKNFLVFCLFLIFYCLFYLKLAVKSNKIGSWFEFLRGTLVGLFQRV